MERNLGSNTGSCCYIFVWGGGGYLEPQNIRQKTYMNCEHTWGYIHEGKSTKKPRDPTVFPILMKSRSWISARNPKWQHFVIPKKPPPQFWAKHLPKP